jgi:hypothetical protein
MLLRYFTLAVSLSLSLSVAWVCERIIRTEQQPLVGQVNAKFADRGRHVVSVTDPYGSILVF